MEKLLMENKTDKIIFSNSYRKRIKQYFCNIITISVILRANLGPGRRKA